MGKINGSKLREIQQKNLPRFVIVEEVKVRDMKVAKISGLKGGQKKIIR